MDFNKKYFLKLFGSALFFFAISALYGLLLRFYKVHNIHSFHYERFLQAHSHVTFLGWGFISVTSMIIYLFHPNWLAEKKIRLYFTLLQVSLLTLLVSFPLTGYKVISISALTVFLITSYILLYKIYSHFEEGEPVVSKKFIKGAILYYYFSSLAIWAIPFIKIKWGKGILYNEAVAFYIHFLYNGFFTMSILGLIALFIHRMQPEIGERIIPYREKILFYRIIAISVIPSFFLISYTLREHHPDFLMYISFFGTGLQLAIVFLLIKYTIKIFSLDCGYLLKPMLCVFSSALILKILAQFLANFPTINTRAFAFSSYFFIGYIHLFTLGFMTIAILWLFYNFTRIKLSIFGNVSLFTGIIISEFLLFTQGFLLFFNLSTIPNFQIILLATSLFMPIGIISILYYLSKSLSDTK